MQEYAYIFYNGYKGQDYHGIIKILDFSTSTLKDPWSFKCESCENINIIDLPSANPDCSK